MNLARLYLLQLKSLKWQADMAQAEVDDLIQQFHLRAVTYDGVKVQVSASDKMAEMMARLERAEKKQKRCYRAFNRMRGEIVGRLSKMPEKASKLLYMRYVQFMPLEKIADSIGYSHDYVRHLHGSVLNDFLELYKADLLEWSRGRT